MNVRTMRIEINLLREKDSLPNETARLVSKFDTRIIKINRLIRRSYGQPLCLQYMADLISCHPTYLSNTYKKIFGISPIKHLQQIRLERAADLLQKEEFKITDISRRVGYISTSQFIEAFRKKYGCTPKLYQTRLNLNVK
ncbi:helix-turn-helix transcriptional regulator [Paenibacillus sp. IITD108]|uniref:helix-turn-helix transcriptional regulator n=1 Tax=Paenibacillus sp. IITD108 TaxID=3116649 RepID=UPI003FA6C54C